MISLPWMWGRRMAESVKVALLGCGTVGTEVVRLLHEQAHDLQARVGAPIELVGIAVRRPNRVREGIPSQLLSSLPYLATILVLVLISRNRRLTMINTPASLGRPFVPDR